MGSYFNIFLLTTFGSLVALVGAVILLSNKSLSLKLTKYSVPFAAGILLTVSLLDLIPESIHSIGDTTFLMVLLAFLGVFVFEHKVFGVHHHEDGHCGAHSHKSSNNGSIYVVILGDTIHNFVDGIAIAASYMLNPALGVVVAVSTFLHEIPHEIGDFGILLNAGWKNKKIIGINLLSALSTYLGALLVIVFGIGDESMIVGYFLSLTAGMFLYLAASDFLPHLDDHPQKNKSILAVLLGVITMMLVRFLLPHS